MSKIPDVAEPPLAFQVRAWDRRLPTTLWSLNAKPLKRNGARGQLRATGRHARGSTVDRQAVHCEAYQTRQGRQAAASAVGQGLYVRRVLGEQHRGRGGLPPRGPCPRTRTGIRDCRVPSSVSGQRECASPPCSISIARSQSRAATWSASPTPTVSRCCGRSQPCPTTTVSASGPTSPKGDLDAHHGQPRPSSPQPDYTLLGPAP